MERYDLVGEIVPMRDGEYYKVKDVHELIKEILDGYWYEERYGVSTRIDRDIWERMQEIVGK